MKKRKIIISVTALVLIIAIVTLLVMCNRKESKMAVFKTKEQFAEWLVAGDYGAAPSRFHSTLGSHPDLEADVSYLVPLIKEYGIPAFTCDEEDFSYKGYITLSPYAQSDSHEPQIIFHIELNGYKYTVYATYITEGVRDLYENPDDYIAGLEEGKGFNLRGFLESYLRLHSPKEIEHGGETYTLYENEEYKIALKSFFTDKKVTDYITWGFIYESVVYRIVFEPGENKERYDAMTAEIPKLKPIIIPYEDFVESEVE